MEYNVIKGPIVYNRQRRNFQRYTSKKLGYEAIKYTGDNYDDVQIFAGNNVTLLDAATGEKYVKLSVPKGCFRVEVGDYIISDFLGRLFSMDATCFNYHYAVNNYRKFTAQTEYSVLIATVNNLEEIRDFASGKFIEDPYIDNKSYLGQLEGVDIFDTYILLKAPCGCITVYKSFDDLIAAGYTETFLPADYSYE